MDAVGQPIACVGAGWSSGRTRSTIRGPAGRSRTSSSGRRDNGPCDRQAATIGGRAPRSSCGASRWRSACSRGASSRSSWATPRASESPPACSTRAGAGNSGARMSWWSRPSLGTRRRCRSCCSSSRRSRPGSRPRGTAIDVPAVLARRPEVVLVDGLAYENPPGSKHAQRWQDVEDLLAAGVSVITSVNLQYVKERQPQVEAIRGKAVKESVPESFLRTADEIELVDAPAEYCVNRLAADSDASTARPARARAPALGAAGDRATAGCGSRRPAARGVPSPCWNRARLRDPRADPRLHHAALARFAHDPPRATAGRPLPWRALRGSRPAAGIESRGSAGPGPEPARGSCSQRTGRDPRGQRRRPRDPRVCRPTRHHSGFRRAQPRDRLADPLHRRTSVERLILEADGIDVRVFPRE